MWPFNKSDSDLQVDVGPPLDERWICQGGNGTLSVMLAFLFLLGGFVGHSIVFRATLRADARRQNGRGLLMSRHASTFMEWIEDTFVFPFVPASLENFVLIIFFAWFLFTITMGITRYYRNFWAVEMVGQQAVFNYFGQLFFACKGKDLMALQYTNELPANSMHIENPERGSPAEIDSYFLPHLTWAMTWLFVGFLQIYQAAAQGWSHNKDVQRKVHKIFGVAALTSLATHIYYASRIAIRNPVDQRPLIHHGYYGLIVNLILLAFYGVKSAISCTKEPEGSKRKDYFHQMHRFRMVLLWLQAIFGSGAIRLTFWFTWLVGHWFPPDWAARIDRTSCQSLSQGSAADCWVPVSLNLNLTNVLITWQIWILFHLIDTTNRDREDFIARFKQSLVVVGINVVIIPLGYYWPESETYILYVLYPLSFIANMQGLWDLQRSMRLDDIAQVSVVTEYTHWFVFGEYATEEEHEQEEHEHED